MKNFTLAISTGIMTFCFSVSINVQAAGKSVSCDLGKDKCSGTPLTKTELNKTFFLSDKLNAELETLYKKEKEAGRDLKVVIVGRMGSDLSKFKILQDQNGQTSLNQLISKYIESNRAKDVTMGPDEVDFGAVMQDINKKETLKYSHLGIALRNLELRSKDSQRVVSGSGTGKWTFLHLLYSCEKPEDLAIQGEYIKSSYIFRSTVDSFFLDHLSGYQAQVIVPAQKIQDRIENTLINQKGSLSFLTKQYNAAAKFNDLEQQNSNQFVLEAVASALRPAGQVSSRQQAIQVLTQSGYSPSKLVPSPTSLFAALNLPFVKNIVSSFMPTICFKTQPELKKYGIGEIVTANSVVNWMRRNSLIQNEFEIGLTKEEIEISTVEEQK